MGQYHNVWKETRLLAGNPSLATLQVLLENFINWLDTLKKAGTLKRLFKTL